MSDQSSGKICIVCGECCDQRPRVKDPKGRYFCRACYEKALQEKKRRKAKGQDKPQSDHLDPNAPSDDASASAPASRRAPTSIGAEDWGMGLADDLEIDPSDESGGPNDDDDSDATAASTAGACPNCGAEFPLAAIICVNCGFNTTTGHTVEAKVGGTIMAKDEVPTNTIWPSAIGILSVVIAIGHIGLSVWGIIDMLLHGGEAAEIEGVDPMMAMIVSILISLPLMVFMGWHGLAGIGLMQRREWGYRHMKRWAKGAIGIVLIIAILVGGLVGVIGLMGGSVAGVVVALTVVGIAAGLLLLWPIILLLWLNRAAVEAEVDEWD